MLTIYSYLPFHQKTAPIRLQNRLKTQHHAQSDASLPSKKTKREHFSSEALPFYSYYSFNAVDSVFMPSALKFTSEPCLNNHQRKVASDNS